LPCAHDQFDNAERLVRLGCGMRLGVPLREQELRGALWRLLEDPAMAAACRRFMELSQPHSIACGKAAQVVERCHREGDARWLKAAS
ncbi:glycosyl transferase family 1, partial [Pseudomonas aeruginosa]|nr:glycosyl transferase family 1 [Pseudomonas aeruginosa]